ncbi:unnamed protein product [Phytomonas sp. EM1]|nr:unnamed protein product [Phytomonas sp. EM1]|eukprot:CCW59572.1 unnamed protein product [Phytomonas sp. isolate EM1]
MIASGITLGNDVSKAMHDVRMKHTRYAVFSINSDGKEIVTTKVGPREATYDQFIEQINLNEPCYVAFDYEYVDGPLISKLLLILWIPDTAKPRIKMLYSSSFDAFACASQGFMRVQVNEAAGLEKSEIVKYIKSHSLLKVS